MARDYSKDSPKPSQSESPPRQAETASGFVNHKTIALRGQSKLDPGLYITATPIGNLRDITIRALETLIAADVILCEDTRVTRKLLDAYGIQTLMIAYHDHNAAKLRPKILARLEKGERLCLVSDAGTPLVSDPGYKLVQDCVAGGYAVTALPGASAPITALTLSGLPSDHFAFFGFLPPKAKARQELLGLITDLPATAIFFESARRLADTLQDLKSVLGDRNAVVARELTKKFEELRRGALSELVDHYQDAGPPKGEIVILVGPGEDSAASEQDIEMALRSALRSHSTKDAVALVADQVGAPRKEVYALALQLREQE